MGQISYCPRKLSSFSMHSMIHCSLNQHTVYASNNPVGISLVQNAPTKKIQPLLLHSAKCLPSSFLSKTDHEGSSTSSYIDPLKQLTHKPVFHMDWCRFCFLPGWPVFSLINFQTFSFRFISLYDFSRWLYKHGFSLTNWIKYSLKSISFAISQTDNYDTATILNTAKSRTQQLPSVGSKTTLPAASG